MRHRAKAYEMRQRRIAGADESALHPHVVTNCCEEGCGKELSLHYTRGRDSPERVGIEVRKIGWQFDEFRVGHTRCPDCLEKKINARKGESGAKTMTSNITLLAVPAERPGAANGTVRDLTTEERGKVRSLLDAHFDDAQGIYLDDYSDHRIGEELKIPRLAVEALREKAYGPLKAVPVIDTAQVDLEAMLVRVESAVRIANEAKRAVNTAATRAAEAETTANVLREELVAKIAELIAIKAKLGVQ